MKYIMNYIGVIHCLKGMKALVVAVGSIYNLPSEGHDLVNPVEAAPF